MISILKPRSLAVMAVIFGLVNTAALHLFYRNRLPGWSAHAQLLFFAQAAAVSLLFLLAAKIVVWLLEKIGNSFGICLSGGGKPAAWYDRHIGLCAFLLILLGWMPWIVL